MQAARQPFVAPRRRGGAVACLAVLLLALPQPARSAGSEERRNWFGDPFTQATFGMPDCPLPAGPLLTEDEMRREAHQRIERGTTCWLAKKCAEPNAYANDAPINAAVVRALAAEARWRDTRLWVITQRRFVFVQGCVRSDAVRRTLLDTVRRVPGVEYVGDELLIGTRGKPPYPVAAGASPPAGRN